jgi:hypothetical protein
MLVVVEHYLVDQVLQVRELYLEQVEHLEDQRDYWELQ